MSAAAAAAFPCRNRWRPARGPPPRRALGGRAGVSQPVDRTPEGRTKQCGGGGGPTVVVRCVRAPSVRVVREGVGGGGGVPLRRRRHGWGSRRPARLGALSQTTVAATRRGGGPWKSGGTNALCWRRSSAPARNLLCCCSSCAVFLCEALVFRDFVGWHALRGFVALCSLSERGAEKCVCVIHARVRPPDNPDRDMDIPLPTPL